MFVSPKTNDKITSLSNLLTNIILQLYYQCLLTDTFVNFGVGWTFCINESCYFWHHTGQKKCALPLHQHNQHRTLSNTSYASWKRSMKDDTDVSVLGTPNHDTGTMCLLHNLSRAASCRLSEHYSSYKYKKCQVNSGDDFGSVNIEQNLKINAAENFELS